MTNKEKSLLHMVKNKQMVTTPFLTKEDQRFLLGHTEDIEFVGGYQNPERVRASLYGAKTDLVQAMKIRYPKEAITLTHQKLLGNLLALGIERDRIGDLLIEQDAFIIAKELSNFLKVSLTKIDQVPVLVEEVNLEDYVHEQSYEDLTYILESLRLDLLVAKLSKTSREQAKSAIVNGQVKINHKVITKFTSKVQEDDIVSIRHYGRILIDDTTKRSKKGKIVVNIKKYQ